MYCVPVGASRRLRWGCLSLAAIVAMLAVTSDPADARRRHKRSHGKLASISSKLQPALRRHRGRRQQRRGAACGGPGRAAPPRLADQDHDALSAVRAAGVRQDRARHADGGVRATPRARRRPSSVCGRATRIKVEDAIKGLVTKSANDAAVVVAEALGGSEEEFARAMTRKARALGMRNTTYRNANGLPNDEQITTARDQALLGIAIQERFPKYYRYFSLASFVYRGNAMRNHNHLLGKVEGVDGIKTGFTRDSGFNLVTSVKRGAPPYRRGGAGRPLRRQPRRADARTDRSAYRRRHRPSRRCAGRRSRQSRSPRPPGCEAAACVCRAPRRLRSAPRSPTRPPRRLRRAPTRRSRRSRSRPSRSSSCRRRTRPDAATAAAASASRPHVTAAQRHPDEALAETLAAAAPIESTAPSAAASRRSARTSGVLGKLPAMMAAAKEAAVPSAKAEPAPPAKVAASAKAEEHSASAPRHTTRGGWAIQVGAYEDEGEAKQHLSSAKSKIAQRPAEGRGLHRAHREGRQDLLPRPFRRLRPRPGRGRLQAPQARRRRLHGVEDLSA